MPAFYGINESYIYISFGLARQQTNNLKLDMSFTCWYNGEDKPGISAWGLSWSFLSPSRL